MSCTCQNCTQWTIWAEKLEIDTPEKKAVFEDMLERIETAETDATHSQLILEGKWPNSKQILEHALANLPAESE